MSNKKTYHHKEENELQRSTCLVSVTRSPAVLVENKGLEEVYLLKYLRSILDMMKGTEEDIKGRVNKLKIVSSSSCQKYRKQLISHCRQSPDSSIKMSSQFFSADVKRGKQRRKYGTWSGLSSTIV